MGEIQSTTLWAKFREKIADKSITAILALGGLALTAAATIAYSWIKTDMVRAVSIELESGAKSQLAEMLVRRISDELANENSVLGGTIKRLLNQKLESELSSIVGLTAGGVQPISG